MNFFFNKKSIPTLLLVVVVSFNGCVSECSVACPDECISIGFYLTKDGINIFERSEFQIDTLFVETLTPNPKSPPSIGFEKKFFKMVVCQNSRYEFNLNDTILIEINSKLDTLKVDDCCAYYTASSLKFNGHELCSNGSCTGGAYEID